MKTKFNMSVISLLVSISMLVVSIYAWFVATGGSLNDIIISVGTVSSEVTLYRVSDFNNDGITDEKEELTLVEAKSTNPYVIGNLNIGSIATFKALVKNTGSSKGIIKLLFRNSKLDLDDKSLLRATTFNVGTHSTLFFMDKYTANDIDSGFSVEVESNETEEIYFNIKFENLESLKILNSDYFSSWKNLNDFQNQTELSLPLIIVRVEQSE